MLPGFPDAMPISGLIGGGLIGLAAAILLLGSGRIAGISGIVSRSLMLSKSPMGVVSDWLFLAGLLIGTAVVVRLNGPVSATFPQSTSVLIIAGVIVGVGTRLGSGCTSGHGVCGMSRLSPRSLWATATFMASGMATVALANAFGWGW